MYNKKTVYSITTGSITDYLDEMERRWGIRMAFIVQMGTTNGPNAVLSVALIIPALQHKNEIPWYKEQLAFLHDCDGTKLMFQMWNMLYEADHQIERGF